MAPIFLPAIEEGQPDEKILKYPELRPYQLLNFQEVFTDYCTVAAEMLTQPTWEIPTTGQFSTDCEQLRVHLQQPQK